MVKDLRFRSRKTANIGRSMPPSGTSSCRYEWYTNIVCQIRLASSDFPNNVLDFFLNCHGSDQRSIDSKVHCGGLCSSAYLSVYL